MQFLKVGLAVIVLVLSSAPLPVNAQVASDAMPVIDASSGCLLGGSIGGKWLKPDEIAPRMAGGDKFRIYSLDGLWKTMTGNKPATQGAPCEDTLYVDVPTELRDSMKQGGQYIGVAGKWNPQPRIPKLESTKNPVYRNVIAELLRRKGIARPQVNIVKVVRIDLDGDGTDEVLINATRVNRWGSGSISSDASAGDYSVVLLRKIINGKVQSIILDEEYHAKATKFSAPNEFAIAAVLDLNGDGIMEVVDAGGYYEGDWKTVYSIQGKKAVDVIGCGCGA